MSEASRDQVRRLPLGPVGRYLADSRNPLNVILLLMPVFLLYSVGILTTGGVRNGVDLASDLLRGGLFEGNALHYFLFNVAAAVVFVVVAASMRGKHAFKPRIYLLVLVESSIYGLLLGFVIGTILLRLGIRPSMVALAARAVADLGPWESFVLSLGAGLWEEIVFRLLLLGGLVLIGKKLLRLNPVLAWVVGIAISSVAFSAIHYTGNMADSFAIYSFMFRLLAGVIFAGLYWARGLAVVVYTHAVYDIIVMVL